MKRLALESFPMTEWTCFALVLFFVLFVGILIWVYRKGSKEIYHHEENLPFQEDN